MRFAKEKARMRRVEGQAKGVLRMMDEGRYCVDIVHQLSAMEAALRATRAKILAIHAEDCIKEAIESGDKQAQRTKIAELAAIFAKAGR